MNTLSDLISHNLCRGDQVLYHSTTEQLTCLELHNCSVSFARELINAGIKPGSPIEIQLENSVAFIVALFGVSLSGCIAILNDTSVDLTSIGGKLSYSPAAVVKKNGKVVELVFTDHGIVDLNVDKLIAQKWCGDLKQLESVFPSRKEDDVAVVLWTSGSSGRQRGIAKTHKNLLTEISELARILDAPLKRYFSVLPWTYIYGLLHHLLLPIYSRGTMFFLRRYTPLQVIEFISVKEIDVFVAVPALYRILANLGVTDLQFKLEWAVSSGATLESSTVAMLADKHGWKIAEFYGSTETGGIGYNTDKNNTKNSVGFPMSTIEIKIDCVDGGMGTIKVKGPTVSMHTYDSNSVECLVDSDGWYDTKDVGFVDDAGKLVLSGRLSRFIKVSGRRVSLDSIEDALRGVPGVLDASVTGYSDRLRGEAAGADVVLERGSKLTLDALHQYCKKNMPIHGRPRKIRLKDSISRERNRKSQ